MKIECIKDKLIRALSKIEKITIKNPTLPILSCVLLEAKEQNLTLKSTNLDVGVEINLHAKIYEEGVVAVSAYILNSYLNASPSVHQITLESKEGVLNISSPLSSTSIKLQPPEDFPVIPSVPKENEFTIPTRDLISGLRSVAYSASVSTIKPELASVYVYQTEGNTYFVATDSFRLAEKRMPTKTKKEIPPILIPNKNIADILRVFEDLQGDLSVAVTKNQISVSFPEYYFTSRIVEGVFPDYKQIVPKEFSTEATLIKQDLVNSLRVMNIFADKFNQVVFSLRPKEKVFEISARNSEVGESTERVDGTFSGEDLIIKFNYKYVIDCFQSIPSDSVTLRFSGEHKPLLVSGGSDQSFTYLVMPMNR